MWDDTRANLGLTSFQYRIFLFHLTSTQELSRLMSTHKYYNTNTNNQQQQQQQQQRDTKKTEINLNKKRRLSAIILSLFVTIFQVEKSLIIKIA